VRSSIALFEIVDRLTKYSGSIVMPPIETSLILEALVSGIRKIAAKEVEEAYSKLKSLLLKKLVKSQVGQDALSKLEENPDDPGLKESLTQELEIADANKDTAVVQTAQNLRAITTQISVSNRHSNGTVITTGRDYVDRRISISLWQLSLLLILAGFVGFGGGSEVYKLPGKLFPLKRESSPQSVSNTSIAASVDQSSSNPKPVARSSPTVTPKRSSPAPVVRPSPTPVPERASPAVAPKRSSPASVDRSRLVLPPVVSSKPKSGVPSTSKIKDSSPLIKRSTNSSNRCRSGLDPFQFVHNCAYTGLLRSYGVPGYGALGSSYQAQTVDAEAIVQAGIKAKLLSPNALQDRDYMNAVELHMRNLP
jgi:hypothetical protein